MDQPGKVANPARGQLNRENEYFPVRVSLCLRIWSRETVSAVPSRVSLLISVLRLDLVLTYGIPPELLITHVRQRGQGNIHFPCSADHEQDWQPYPVDPYFCYMCDHTYIRATNKYFVLIYYS